MIVFMKNPPSKHKNRVKYITFKIIKLPARFLKKIYGDISRSSLLPAFIASMILILGTLLTDKDVATDIFGKVNFIKETFKNFWIYDYLTTTNLFYITLFSLTIFVFSKEYFDKSEKKRMKNEQIRLLSTQPSPELLNSFRTMTLVTKQHLSEIAETLDTPQESYIERVENAIRLNLSAILHLLQKFESYLILDEVASERRYSANVMINEPIEEIKQKGEGYIKKIINSLELFIDSPSLYGLDGALILDLELSVAIHSTDSSNYDEEIEKDENLKNIALPIPDNQGISRLDTTRSKVLAGAPQALLTGMDYIPDTHKLLENFEKENELDLARGVLVQENKYFRKGEGKEIKSILSIALLSGGGRNTRLGVINLNSSKRNMFQQSTRDMNQFTSLITPFLLDISTLIYYREFHRNNS